MIGISFLLSCYQFFVVPFPKHGTLPARCMTHINCALKIFLVNFMLMPGMCSVLMYTFDTYMQDVKQIGFRDWFNITLLSICCRAVSYRALSFWAIEDGIIPKVVIYTWKAFCIHFLIIVFLVTVGFPDLYSIDPKAAILH